MRVASIVLKVLCITLGSIPFVFIGFFFLAGGPCPAATQGSPLRLMGIPFGIFAVFWALPNRVILDFKKWSVIIIAIIFYILPTILLSILWIWSIFSKEHKIIFSLSPVIFLLLCGMLCSGLSYLLARKSKQIEEHDTQIQ